MSSSCLCDNCLVYTYVCCRLSVFIIPFLNLFFVLLLGGGTCQLFTDKQHPEVRFWQHKTNNSWHVHQCSYRYVCALPLGRKMWYKFSVTQHSINGSWIRLHKPKLIYGHLMMPVLNTLVEISIAMQW